MWTEQNFDNFRADNDKKAVFQPALGLLLADGVLTVGWGKTFWRVGRVPTLENEAIKLDGPNA